VPVALRVVGGQLTPIDDHPGGIDDPLAGLHLGHGDRRLQRDAPRMLGALLMELDVRRDMVTHALGVREFIQQVVEVIV
jgi:hypothetical protein